MVRVTDPLVRVATEEEVLEYAGAFMQLYREEAHYLERTAPWIERLGIDYVKRHLVDDAEARARAACAVPLFAALLADRSLGRARRGRRRT